MNWHKTTLTVQTRGKGLYSIEDELQNFVRKTGMQEGMCYLFIQHTSASLTINENFDPTAKRDLETYLERSVPENQAWMHHTLEGGDDSSSHIRSMLTQPSLTIPIENQQLCLGTWQGVFLFEHRAQPHRRKVLIRCLDVQTTTY